ncbi:MAG: DMP19 family protein [Flavobacteriales bacterium]
MGFFSFFGCKSDKNTDLKSEKDKERQYLIDKSFKEFNNRKIYDTLTSEIIDSLEDDKLLQTIFENIETNFEDGEQYTKEKISKLTKGQQAIFSIWMLQTEVNNGGFNQFYYNSSGQFSEMAKDGLEYVGAEKFSQLVDKANKAYSVIKDELESKNDGTIESFSKSYEDNPLNDFDDKFYKLEESENLDSLQIVFIKENKEEFIKERSR